MPLSKDFQLSFLIWNGYIFFISQFFYHNNVLSIKKSFSCCRQRLSIPNENSQRNLIACCVGVGIVSPIKGWFYKLASLKAPTQQLLQAETKHFRYPLNAEDISVLGNLLEGLTASTLWVSSQGNFHLWREYHLATPGIQDIRIA